MIVLEEGEVKMSIGLDQVQLLCWNEVIGKGSKGEGLRWRKSILLAVDHVGGLHRD